MKLFPIRGGVHPDDRKAATAELPIEAVPLPSELRIPVHQHIGAAAVSLVDRGDRVCKGQPLARGDGKVTAPVHAPTSGHVTDVGPFVAHHPSGLGVRTITLKPDGEDEWAPRETTPDPLSLGPRAIAARVAEAGIVGMGGATFPTAIKLDLGARCDLSTLVINGAECEPYLTCDDRLLRERAVAVLDGARIMARALGVARVIIGIENNKPAAQASVEALTHGEPLFSLARLPTRYPMGSERHLVQTLTGKETPAGKLTADIGFVVHNPATAAAVHEALRFGRPLISRIVTVSGGAVREPKNLEVLIGTRVQDLIDFCGGFGTEPARLVSGGPMMGQPLPNTGVPIVKGSNGIIALTESEISSPATRPCIRCASCVRACPSGLVPVEMADFVRVGDIEGAVRYGLLDCIVCGSCAFTCPSGVPLVQFFRHAKGELAAQRVAQQKNQETTRLAEARTARLEKIKAAKRAELARRKKARQAKKGRRPGRAKATEGA